MATKSTRNLSFEQAQAMWPGIELDVGDEHIVRRHFTDDQIRDAVRAMGRPLNPRRPLPLTPEQQKEISDIKAMDKPEVSTYDFAAPGASMTYDNYGNMKIEAVKADNGKTHWHLLPWDSVEEIVKVMEFGAGKYSPWNWANNGGFAWHRLFNSSMRHFIAWFWKREDNDPETGISHLAHLGCNVFFLLHYTLNKEKFNKDDRESR